MTGRRSFFKRALAFLGIAGTTCTLVCTEVDAETNTMTLEGPSDANLRIVPEPSIYLVDATRIDRRELETIRLSVPINTQPNDLFIIYLPAPGDNFPPIMRVPDVTLEELRAGLGNWGNRIDASVFADLPYMQTPFTREELGLK
jgi:hypothetical protein